jgi:hypothetical protein
MLFFFLFFYVSIFRRSKPIENEIGGFDLIYNNGWTKSQCFLGYYYASLHSKEVEDMLEEKDRLAFEPQVDEMEQQEEEIEGGEIEEEDEEAFEEDVDDEDLEEGDKEGEEEETNS